MKQLLIIIAVLVLMGCGPSVPDMDIHDAAADGNIEDVKYHLANGINVDAVNDRPWKTPLSLATREGHKEIVKILIAKGADVNAKAQESALGLTTPLNWAITRNHIEIADLLRKHGGKTAEELKAEGK